MVILQRRLLPNKRELINLTQGSSQVTRGHWAATCFTQHLKGHQRAGLVMPLRPSTFMFSLLNQPASVGVVLFLLEENKRECPCPEHCDIAFLKGMRAVRLVYSNMLSSRMCDFKEKSIKIENRQKRGEGRSRKRGTWIVQWREAYGHQLKKIVNQHIWKWKKERKDTSSQKGKLNLLKLPALPTPFPSQSDLLCYICFRCKWNKIIYLEYCLLTSLFPASTKYLI